ncbi:MAG: antitoxin [Actinobacteria bacterium]|nr:antitoxin [Actinomycetota bacterium]
MVDVKGLIDKAKAFARSNPDKVRDGVDKVEELVNRKTGGKYADQVAKGAAAAENALGVPGEAKRAFTDEANLATEPPPPVRVEPIQAPEPIDRPDAL